MALNVNNTGYEKGIYGPIYVPHVELMARIIQYKHLGAFCGVVNQIKGGDAIINIQNIQTGQSRLQNYNISLYYAGFYMGFFYDFTIKKNYHILFMMRGNVLFKYKEQIPDIIYYRMGGAVDNLISPEISLSVPFFKVIKRQMQIIVGFSPDLSLINKSIDSRYLTGYASLGVLISLQKEEPIPFE